MAKLAPRASTRFGAASSAKVPARKSVHNEILLGLPTREYGVLSPELEPLELKTHQVLNEMGLPIEWCYFVEQGLVSILNVMSDGKSVEVGITGKEGFVGLPLAVGLKTSSTRALVQVAASAYRVRSTALARVLEKCPQL